METVDEVTELTIFRDGKVVTISEHSSCIGQRALGAARGVCVAHFDENWIICRKNIGAWRRPKR